MYQLINIPACRQAGSRINNKEHRAMQNLRQFIIFMVFFTLLGLAGRGQQCTSGNPSQTVNVACGVSCADLRFTLPDIRETSDYLPLDLAYNPYPFEDRVIPAVTFASPPKWPGNSYSPAYDLPFTFCFFDSL